MNSRKLKLLHVSSALGWRGGERQAYLLIHHLNKLFPNTENYLFCSRNSVIESKAAREKLSFQSAFKISPMNPFYASGIQNYASSKKVDLIHSHDAHAHAFSMKASQKLTLPLIVSRRVDVPIKEQRRSQNKYLAPNVKKVLCVSHKIKNICDQSCPGIQSKTAVVHSGIDLTPFASLQKTGWLHDKLNLSEETQIIGNVSALVDHKDYPCFLKSAQLIHTHNPKTHFVILGAGPLENSLKALSQSLGLENCVSFLGHQEKVLPFLIEFDLFLFTSKTEGLGSTVLDAFAAKVPVVSTNGGGIGEMVLDQETGLVSAVGDHENLSKNSLLVLKNSQLREKIVNNASQRVLEFSAEQTARKTYQHYMELFNS